jgi:hypothetical protein
MKCEEANHVCDKNQYKEAGLLEKIRLTFHLIYCRACRKYSSRNSKLSKAIERSDLKTLDQNDKQVMKEVLKKELNN